MVMIRIAVALWATTPLLTHSISVVACQGIPDRISRRLVADHGSAPQPGEVASYSYGYGYGENDGDGEDAYERGVDIESEAREDDRIDRDRVRKERRANAPGPGGCTDCRSEYDQCGGRELETTVCCESPFACISKNEFYAQCMNTERVERKLQDGWQGAVVECGRANLEGLVRETAPKSAPVPRASGTRNRTSNSSGDDREVDQASSVEPRVEQRAEPQVEDRPEKRPDPVKGQCNRPFTASTPVRCFVELLAQPDQ